MWPGSLVHLRWLGRELHCSLSSVPVFSISTFFPSKKEYLWVFFCLFFGVEFHMLPFRLLDLLFQKTKPNQTAKQTQTTYATENSNSPCLFFFFFFRSGKVVPYAILDFWYIATL